jgi:hypothetical protein
MQSASFRAAQATTLARRDARRYAAQANTLGLLDPKPADHDTQVARLLAQGYHVEIQTAQLTQLVKGHRVNHILHLLLSVFTAGLWLPVWIGVTAFGGGRRKTIAR